MPASTSLTSTTLGMPQACTARLGLSGRNSQTSATAGSAGGLPLPLITGSEGPARPPAVGSLFLSWKRTRGGALLAALNGGQVSSRVACAAGHVPAAAVPAARLSRWKGWPLGA